MILKSRLPLAAPLPAATDMVANAIAEELRSHGCTIRHVTGGVVEFDGPNWAAQGEEHGAAAMVTGGAVWVSPTGTEMRVTLRIGWQRLLVIAAIACAVAFVELNAATRMLILLVLACIALANLDAARHAFEDWAHRALRRV